MKKKFYILLIAMIVSFAATAQRFEYQLGLKGGAGLAILGSNDDNIVSKDNGLCYKFGLTGIYYFGENYGFSSGFSIMGNDMSYKYKLVEEVDGDIIEKTVDRNLHNTYLQIPILLKMRTESFADRFRIFGEIGYGLNLFVKENDKYDFHHPYRDVCSSFILRLGLDVEVLSRSTLQFMVAYDTFFSSMMTESSKKLTMSDLCFEIGFLF